MTTNQTRNIIITLTTAMITIAILVGANGAQAASPPIKLVFASHFGREVNLTQVAAKSGPALEDICTIESKDECAQQSKPSSIPGGFEFPQGVAGTPSGNVYITDTGNHRVQELKSNGEFISMFGKEVDATTKGNICTAASKDICKKGLQSSAPGELGEGALSVTVDPVSSNVYVAERVEQVGQGFSKRVQEFTAGGQFVLEIGREVNEKTKGNLCTQAEVEEKLGVKCVGPAESISGSKEPGAFNFELAGNVLAAGGSEDLLYVGDEGRVQEFKANGQFAGEIPLPAGGRVRALALDGKTNDLYLAYGNTNIIQRFNSKGESISPPIEVSPSVEGARVSVLELAIDSEDHLAVGGQQETNTGNTAFGLLYVASTGRQLTAFTTSSLGIKALGFNGNGELYAATIDRGEEIWAYKPEFVAELVTGTATCLPGAEHVTDATLDCTLHGEVNPEGVSETVALFQWGTTCAPWSETIKQSVLTGNSFVSVSAVVSGLKPNETFCYRLVGEDHNVKTPELLTGEKLSFATPFVAARIVGEPNVSFVKSSSAVMFGELNPENANTEYFFEYAAGQKTLAECSGGRKANCPGVGNSGAALSAEYGKIATTLEATGLQPNTTYHYRLSAENENQAKTEKHAVTGTEGSFTTAPAPVPSAETGPNSMLTATSAIITGTVNPDGLPATYAFEIGIDNGTNTQYGTVFTGPAGSTTVQKTLQLTGLQPATTYAYRITISSGYINNQTHTIQGAPNTFTTNGIPIVLVSPPPLTILPLPPIGFPTIPKACKHGYTHNKHDKCVKQKHKKSKKAHKTTQHTRATAHRKR